MRTKILALVLPFIFAGLLFAAVIPTYADGPDLVKDNAAYGDVIAYDDSYDVPYLYGAPIQVAQTLSVNIDTSTLFTGAQTMLDALTSPYLLIAGFGLGVAILAAVMKAVTSLRL